MLCCIIYFSYNCAIYFTNIVSFKKEAYLHTFFVLLLKAFMLSQGSQSRCIYIYVFVVG